MIRTTVRTSTFLITIVLLVGARLPGPGQHPADLSLARVQRVSASGAAVCNCDRSALDLTVCHASQVSLTFGGETLDVATGHSGSDCLRANVPPGKCVYVRYSFTCFRQGLMGGWYCYLDGAGLHCRGAVLGMDCPPVPAHSSPM